MSGEREKFWAAVLDEVVVISRQLIMLKLYASKIQKETVRCPGVAAGWMRKMEVTVGQG